MGSAHRFMHLCGGCPRRALPALAATIVLSMTVLPVVAADVLLPLPDVKIPPAQGKTGSFDIMEVDQGAHLLYVADRTTGGVDIFDVKTPAAQYVQTINTGAAPNGVALAKNVNKLFVGAADSSVVIIDIAPGSPTRNTIIARLNTGGKKRTDEMDYDPVDKKLYAANSDDGIVVSVDAVRNMIVKKFENMGDGLEQPRYNPSDGMMYLTSSDQNAVFQFDPRSDTLVRKVTVGVECNPNGLAINPSTNQAILGCSNKKTPMTVLWDVTAARVITTFPDVGAGDAAIYDAKTNLFFFAASNFPKGAALAVFSGSPVRWIANAPTAVGSHAVAYDETNRIVYTLNQQQGQAGLMAFWLVSESLK
jgi:DNA-binding beta-propeller fold protein YncE